MGSKTKAGDEVCGPTASVVLTPRLVVEVVEGIGADNMTACCGRREAEKRAFIFSINSPLNLLGRRVCTILNVGEADTVGHFT